ncbi:MAG: NAD(P)H-dependent oxidoreductase subunit E, partial [Gemmatimonadaceae bacterium]
MDIRLLGTDPTAEERSAVDDVLGAPTSSWDGGERGSERDAHTAIVGGRATREQRHLLLPALQALQARIGFITEGGLDYVCERLGVPPAEAWGVATFYAMLATTPRPRRVLHVCDDIACRAKGAAKLCATLERKAGPAITHEPEGDHVALHSENPAWMHSPCLGLCDVAPAALMVEAGEQVVERSIGGATASTLISLLAGDVPPADGAGRPHTGKSAAIVCGGLLQRVGKVDPTSLAAYRAAGGYAALAKARALTPKEVTDELLASELRGRGGAFFATGRKWSFVPSKEQLPKPHYLVVNADESEPGTFKDRDIMLRVPHRLIEGCLIAAHAIESTSVFIYIRGEYLAEYEILAAAVDEARDAGIFGDVEITVHRGAGAYICGEETALLESLEGKRGQPRPRPPFPPIQGLYMAPTQINNVCTIATVPS